MENPEVFYLSADDYEAVTTESALVDALEDEQVQELLLEAMVEIDSYIGEGWTRFDDDQEFVFPREQDVDEDDNPFIPRNVGIATRIIADAILKKRQGRILPHEVDSESRLGRSFTRRRQEAAESGYEHWPPEVFSKLQRYRQSGGELAVSDSW